MITNKVRDIFEIVVDLNDDFRRHAFMVFLQRCADFDTFDTLPLLPNHWSGSGSFIPAYQHQIRFLESLFQYVKGIEYLRHKEKIRKEIEHLQDRIRGEQVDEIYRKLYS